MSDSAADAPDAPTCVEQRRAVVPPGAGHAGAEAASGEPSRSSQPAKVMRIGSMIKQLLEEVRAAPSSTSRAADRLRGDLRDLGQGAGRGPVARPAGRARRLALPVRRRRRPRPTPSCGWPRPSWSGWLEGLFHGIQATLFAQQMAARQQLEQMRGQLVPGQLPGAARCRDPAGERPGTYL